MKPSILLSFLFIFSLISISHADSLSSSSKKLYKIVCKDAGKDNDRCLKLLEADPRVVSAKDYVTLCKFILEMAIDKATRGQKYLKNLLRNTHPPSQAIKYCATVDYNELVYSFKSSLGELVVDPLTANYDAKVAGDGPETCERQLASEKIVNPAISSLNDNMSFLSFVAFLATNYLM